MELEKLNDSNPWWPAGRVPDELKGVARPEYGLLLRSVGIREITIITGVRRSGKSTMMYQMIDSLLKGGLPPEQVLFINLENPKLSGDGIEDAYRAYREGLNPDRKAYIFLDEIHRREGWESWIRNMYDAGENCKFVVSGSCSYLLKKEYSTLMTGRNISFAVFPLSFAEFLLFRGVDVKKDSLKKGIVTEKDKNTIVKHFSEYMESGGFPAVFFRPREFKTALLAQYFDDIIYKDIVDRHNLNAQKTRDFALYLMANFGCPLSLRSVRSSLGLSYDAIKDYLSHFREAFLFFPVDHFSYSIKEQKTMPSKIYCIDNGLRNAVSFRFMKDEGRMAENLVFMELKRRGNDVYYWKSEKQHEVDFVVKEIDQSLTAINVSYTNDIDERETRSLKTFKKEFAKTGKMILLTKNLEKKESGIFFIPLWKWALLR